MRQFIAEQPLDSKGCLCVQGKNFRYLNTVLRCSEGDMIDVRLTDGILQPMTVASIDSSSKKIILQVAGENLQNQKHENQVHVDISSLLDFWLVQFIAKPVKMELIIRQAVECGTGTIVPVKGEFCQKGCIESAVKQGSASDGRWARIVTEARQQSGSPVQTAVTGVMDLKESLFAFREHCKAREIPQEEQLCVVLYEQSAETKRIYESAGALKKVRAAALFVGAEGGISPQEIDFLKGEGVVPVHLETNILRCETASLYGTAALQTVLLQKMNGV